MQGLLLIFLWFGMCLLLHFVILCRADVHS